jgi:hypothetical protein
MSDLQPGAGAPQPSNGMAIASMVLGIVSIITAIIPFIGMIAWILAPLGLILGFIALNKPGGRGMAIAGLITSGFGLLICILWVVGLGAAMSGAGTY